MDFPGVAGLWVCPHPECDPCMWGTALAAESIRSSPGPSAPKSSTHCSRETCCGFMVWKPCLKSSTFYLPPFEFLERKVCCLTG